MNKNVLKTMLVAIGLAAGTVVTWGQNVIYERGIQTNWSTDDLTEWILTEEGGTATIDNGLSTSGGNSSYCFEKNITTTSNSLITFEAEWNTGSSVGRSLGYNYLSIGDIQLRAYGQDQKGTIIIGNTETTLTSNKADVRDNAKWKIYISINQATKAVKYSITVPNAAQIEGEGVTNNELSTIKLGYYKPGRITSTNQTLINVKVSEKQQEVETATYTIKYEDKNNIELKPSEIRTGAVGTEITLLESDKDIIYSDDGQKKYIYESINGNNTITPDGKTEVTIIFREAETWNYTLNAIDSNEDILSELSKGQNFEGETFNVPYLKYIEKNGVLYEANDNNQQYNYSLTLDENNKIVNINYNTTDIKNVVLYKEAEDIEGLTSTSAGNADIRCSNALGAYNNGESPVKIVTLTPGTYKMTATIWGNSGTNILINYGSTEDWAIATKGYIYTESKDITLDETTDITMPVCGSSTKCLDYIYIQKISDKVSITDAGVATFTPSVALDFSNAKNIAAYKASVSGTTVNLTKVETVAAGEGVLVRSINGDAINEDIPVAADVVSTSEDNMFVGTLTDINNLPTDGDGYTNYILNNGSKGLGFYRANNQTVAAGKAYLAVPAASAAKISFFSIDGGTVGIEGIESNEEAEEDVYYTISGQRVAAPTKGLYIKNGKKVIVK